MSDGRSFFLWGIVLIAVFFELCCSFGYSFDIPENLDFLLEVEVDGFVCDDLAPDVAIGKLIESVDEEYRNRIFEAVFIQSFSNPEPLVIRDRRYQNHITLKVGRVDFFSLFRSIVTIAGWHIEYRDSKIVVCDWHKGKLE